MQQQRAGIAGLPALEQLHQLRPAMGVVGQGAATQVHFCPQKPGQVDRQQHGLATGARLDGEKFMLLNLLHHAGGDQTLHGGGKVRRKQRAVDPAALGGFPLLGRDGRAVGAPPLQLHLHAPGFEPVLVARMALRRFEQQVQGSRKRRDLGAVAVQAADGITMVIKPTDAQAALHTQQQGGAAPVDRGAAHDTRHALQRKAQAARRLAGALGDDDQGVAACVNTLARGLTQVQGAGIRAARGQGTVGSRTGAKDALRVV